MKRNPLMIAALAFAAMGVGCSLAEDVGKAQDSIDPIKEKERNTFENVTSRVITPMPARVRRYKNKKKRRVLKLRP